MHRKRIEMSMTKLNIQEANGHLRQLHKKVYELETKIHMQAMHTEELEAANLKLKQQLKKSHEDSSTTLKEKEEVVSELQKQLEESEQYVQSLLQAAEERDKVFEKLEKKARLFYEVVEHRSTLANMVKILDELSINDGLQGSYESDTNSDKGKLTKSQSYVSSGSSTGSVTQECNGQGGGDGDLVS